MMMTSLPLIALLALAGEALGSAQPPSEKPALGTPGAFDIEMDSAGRVTRALVKNASLRDVASRLAILLKVPVKVSGALERRRVTLSKADGMSLPELLAQLAPAPFVDSREMLGRSPQLVAVHLLESSEVAPPAVEATGIVIEGTVDDPVDEGGASGASENELRPGDQAAAKPAKEGPPEEGPFLVVRRLSDGRLNVDARDQGMGVLLFEVAQACGARFDLRIPEAPIVSRISVNGILPSELPGLLAIPGVGVDVRRNLLTGEETVLRFFVEAAS